MGSTAGVEPYKHSTANWISGFLPTAKAASQLQLLFHPLWLSVWMWIWHICVFLFVCLELWSFGALDLVSRMDALENATQIEEYVNNNTV